MSAEWLGWLFESTAASSAALLLVLAVRRPWRQVFGAPTVPWVWLLVPLAIVAVTLPAPAQPLLAEVASTGWGAAVGAGSTAVTAQATDPSSLLMLWAGGAAMLAWRLVAQQRRFRRRMGRLRPGPAGSWLAERDDVGPALVGLWRPRIILPADFATRYSPEQQALVIAHERCHLRRGDLHVSLLASLLRCVYWFNPLLPAAFRALRFDLELACDAATLATHPRSRRSYADALLNTQLTDPGLPVGCHWQSSHPLKRRIAMLKKSPAGPARTLLAGSLACTLAIITATTAWAVQPPDDADAAMTVDVSPGQTPPPKYPKSAIEAKQEGKVVLRLLVGTDGRAKSVEVEESSSSAALDQAAIDSVAGWTFNPAQRDGVPVEGWVLVPVTFALDGDPDAKQPPMPAQG